MSLQNLQFSNAGPFNDIMFEFDEHVNVFVGPNNCGKSTALTVLGGIVVWPFVLPKRLFRQTEITFTVHFTGREAEGKTLQASMRLQPGPLPFLDDWEQWGAMLAEIGYTSFIPALRQSTDFRSEGPMVQTKTTQVIDWLETKNKWGITYNLGSGFEEPPEEFKKRSALLETHASLIRDEAIIQSIIELDSRAYRHNDPAIRDIIYKIAAMASEITEGFPIEFIRIAEDEGGLFPQFRTPDGDVPLNVLSQGTQSILQWLASLLIGYAKYYDYAANLEEQPGILIIDEIDAHLHPSWQRRIIPTLRRHFPNLQLFCSTHSPLMLAGLQAGQVQLLKRDPSGKVTVSRNETDVVGWSADEILRNFLEVPNPTDFETDRHIKRLQELRHRTKLSKAEAHELEQLRHMVNQELRGGPIAMQMEQLSALLERAQTEPANAPGLPGKARTRTKSARKSATSDRTPK